jgi:predicted phage-related endonuclease
MEHESTTESQMTFAELHERVRDLQNELATHIHDIDVIKQDNMKMVLNLRQEKEERLADMESISEALHEMADERGWDSSAFSAWLKDLNNKLSLEIPEKEMDYECTIEYRVYVKIPFSSSPSDAEDNADSIYDSLYEHSMFRPSNTDHKITWEHVQTSFDQMW